MVFALTRADWGVTLPICRCSPTLNDVYACGRGASAIVRPPMCQARADTPFDVAAAGTLNSVGDRVVGWQRRQVKCGGLD